MKKRKKGLEWLQKYLNSEHKKRFGTDSEIKKYYLNFRPYKEWPECVSPEYLNKFDTISEFETLEEAREECRKKPCNLLVGNYFVGTYKGNPANDK